jgi:hypothetical protein
MSDFLWMASIPVVFAAILFGIVYAAVISSNRFDTRAAEVEEMWRGAVVVRICKSGAHIYRMRDGSLRTGGWSSTRVQDGDVSSICD